MIRNVAVVASDGFEAFGLGVLCEVWNEPYHPEDDVPTFDFAVCTPRPGRVRGGSGFDLHIDHGLDRLDEADLVAVVPIRDYESPPPEVCAALRRAHDRGALILASCTAVFTLAAAGLLDARRVTTHWRHAGRLAELFPAVEVDPDVLYVQDGSIVTGAGSAAGLDACLHIIRTEFGAQVAAMVARRMVVPPLRDGGQAQFVRHVVADQDADTLTPILTWMTENLDAEVSVEGLARRSHMSARTFARRFREETGTTPHQWLTHQRILLAERLLEETNLPVEEVARRSGFGNSAALRHHFTRIRGTSPVSYRRTFGCAVAPGA